MYFLAALHPSKYNPVHFLQQILLRTEHVWNWNTLAISSVPEFEFQNPSISVNVLVQDQKDFVPIYTLYAATTGP